MPGYGVFAKYYDALTRNVGYPARAKALARKINLYRETPAPKPILVDLACGTGSFAEEFARQNFDVIGVDASEEMLSEALAKKAQSGAEIQYLRQDMRALNLFGTADAVICALDSLNHLRAEADLRRVFSRVSLFLEKGGVFLFDVNTAYKHERVLAGQCFVYDIPDVFCVWQNELLSGAPDYPVRVILDFFEKDGQRYTRETERFEERVFPPEILSRTLRETDFELLETLDGDTFETPKEDSQRILYIARKRGEIESLTNRRAAESEGNP